MDERDKQVVEAAQAAFESVNSQYWATDDIGTRAVLRPQIEVAATKLALARIKLLKAGTLAEAGDVAEIERIRSDIDEAADNQATLIGAVRLVAFLAKFA